MNRKDLLFADGITFTDVNPFNTKLGNDFISNLIPTCIAILPRLEKYTGSKLKLHMGFVSESNLKSKYGIEDINWYWKKFAFGLGLAVSWNDWDILKAIEVSNKLYEAIPENIHVYISHTDKTITVLRKMRDRMIIIKDDNKIIRNDNSIE